LWQADLIRQHHDYKSCRSAHRDVDHMIGAHA